MERVKFCSHCGELLEAKWMHCPWCGCEVSKNADNWRVIVDSSLQRAAAEHMKGSMGRLENLSGKLNELELELDAFLASKS